MHPSSRFPAANASSEGASIVYRDYINLSIAVATPKGLVTPMLRNAEAMGFLDLDIEKGIAELGKKARDSKLTIEDMAGGSFTMLVFRVSPRVRACETSAVYNSSNGGIFGGLVTNMPRQHASSYCTRHAPPSRASPSLSLDRSSFVQLWSSR